MEASQRERHGRAVSEGGHLWRRERGESLAQCEKAFSPQDNSIMEATCGAGRVQLARRFGRMRTSSRATFQCVKKWLVK